MKTQPHYIAIIPFILLFISLFSIVTIKNNHNSSPNNFGYLTGSFNVNDVGGLSYSIPISVTPGTGGIQPSLALSYSNQKGNGMLGVGWTLNGISMITRSPKTIAQDGEAKGIGLGSDDVFSLNGERLVLVSGTYGSNNAEYRTEQNTLMKVKSFGSVNGVPERFKVWTKDGLIMDFGSTTDARIETLGGDVIYWNINKIEDTKGNYMFFEYIEDTPNLNHLPFKISYTGNNNTGLTPYASVEFEYINRTDTIPSYVNGYRKVSDKLLSKIKSKYDNNIVREYQFTYNTATYTGTSLLQSVTECGTQGNCHDPLEFSWKNEETLGFAPKVQNQISNLASSNNVSKQVYNGDFNGDGIVDFFVFDETSGSNYCYFNDKDYNFPLYTNTLSPNLIKKQSNNVPILATLDINADGFTDFFWYDLISGTNKIFINQKDTGITVPTFNTYTNIVNPNYLKIQGQNPQITYFNDFDGDGRSDLIVVNKGTGLNRIHLNSSTGNSITFTQSGGNIIPMSEVIGAEDYKHFIPLDFNSDGKTDVVWYDESTGTTKWFENEGIVNNAITFSPKVEPTTLPTNLLIGDNNTTNHHEIGFGEFNGDGVIDLVWYDKVTGVSRWFFNKGDLTFKQVNHNLSTTAVDGADGTWSFTDINKDGISDLVYFNKVSGENNWFLNDGHCDFSLSLNPTSTLSGYRNPISQSELVNGISNLYIGNYSGHTLTDVFWYTESSGTNKFFKGDITSSNVIDTFKMGNGSQIAVEYSDLTDPEVYQRENTSIYPFYDLQTTMSVVKSYSTDDGVGGKNVTSYYYKGAKTHLEGRGFRGFTEIQITNEKTGVTETRFFKKDYRYLSSPMYKSETRLGDGTLLSENTFLDTLITYYYNGNPLSNGLKSHFSYNTQVVKKSYELDGTLVSTITNRQKIDDYGNVLWYVIDYGDGNIDSTFNEYDPASQDIPNWILGRLTKSKVLKKAPNKPWVVSTAAFEYGSDGLLTKEIIEPDSNNTIKIEKEYIHDTYGNILQSKVTAHNGTTLQTRNTYTAFDNKGRFTLTQSNDLGHTLSKIYNPLTGHLIKETDVNGITKRYEYDEFGRKTKEIGHDGNYIQTAIKDCQTGNCPTGAVFYIEMESSAAPKSITYYDLLNREILKEGAGFDSTTVYQATIYSSLGYKVQESAPYFVGNTPQWTTYEYDTVGRVIKVTAPDNSIMQRTFNGFTTTITNPLGQTKTTIKNALNQLMNVSDNLGNAINYEYNSYRQLIKTTDPNNNQITMTYDALGNQSSMTDPDLGHYQYQYNGFGELVSETNPKGQIADFEYDILGRMTKRTEPEGITTWSYDTQPNGVGMLAGITAPNYNYTTNYDTLGRVVSSNEIIDGTPYTTHLSYTTEGRVNEVVYPSNFTIKNVYNNQGFLEEVRNATTTQLYWKADAVNARGQLEQQTFGNNVSTIQTFDVQTGLLQKIETGNTSTNNIQNLFYVFNDIGTLTQRSDLNQGLNEYFTYDGLNRLIRAMVLGVDTVDVGYDNIGNITYKSDVGYYQYGQNGAPAKQLTGINNLTGACIPTALSNFTFNSYNKVTEITKDSNRVEFVYGPDRGRTIQRFYRNDTVLTKTKIHIGQLYEREITDTLTKELFYIRANGSVIAVNTAQSNGTNTTHYWHKDHLGSIESITDDNGQLVAHLSFDAWGKRRNADWSPLEVDEILDTDYDRGYTGHEHLDLFGLVNMNGRIYDPVIGRFISPDPFLQAPDNLQNYNRYGYVLNNPLSFTDPSGFWSVSVLGFKFDSDEGFSVSFDPASWVPFDVNDTIRNTINKVGDEVFGDNWNSVKVTAVSVAVGFATGGVGTLAGAILSGAASGFAGGFVGTMLSGGSVGDAFFAGFQGAAIGGLSAGLTYGVGNLANSLTAYTGLAGGNVATSMTVRYGIKAIGHGMVQGTISTINGNKFEHGFISGFFSGLGEAPMELGLLGHNRLLEIVGGSLIGGTTSALGGGKFVNGALSGAFVTMYNKQSTSTFKLKEVLGITGGALVLAGSIMASPAVLGYIGVSAVTAGVLQGLGIATYVVGSGLTGASGLLTIAKGVENIQNGNYKQGVELLITGSYKAGTSLLPTKGLQAFGSLSKSVNTINVSAGNLFIHSTNALEGTNAPTSIIPKPISLP